MLKITIMARTVVPMSTLIHCNKIVLYAQGKNNKIKYTYYIFCAR